MKAFLPLFFSLFVASTGSAYYAAKVSVTPEQLADDAFMSQVADRACDGNNFNSAQMVFTRNVVEPREAGICGGDVPQACEAFHSDSKPDELGPKRTFTDYALSLSNTTRALLFGASYFTADGKATIRLNIGMLKDGAGLAFQGADGPQPTLRATLLQSRNESLIICLARGEEVNYLGVQMNNGKESGDYKDIGTRPTLSLSTWGTAPGIVEMSPL